MKNICGEYMQPFRNSDEITVHFVQLLHENCMIMYELKFPFTCRIWHTDCYKFAIWIFIFILSANPMNANDNAPNKAPNGEMKKIERKENFIFQTVCREYFGSSNQRQVQSHS